MPGARRTEHEEQNISEPRINDRIRVPEVRLVGPGGEQVGVVRIEVALNLAQEADLDLVEVAPDARPPVAKLMDFGKYKYESDMKAREARRNQANTQLKEIRFRLKIDAHDYETKKGHVVRFLSAGDKVKTMIMFRGREQSRPEMGVRLLQRLAADVEEYGFVESMPKQDGRNMTMVLGPVKKKAEAKQQQRKRSSERAERSAAKAEKTASPAPEASAGAAAPAAGSEPAAATKPTAADKPAAAQTTSAPAAAEPAVAKPSAKPATAAAKPATAKKPAAAPAKKAASEKKPAADKKPAAEPAPSSEPSASSTAAAAKARPAPRPKPASTSS